MLRGDSNKKAHGGVEVFPSVASIVMAVYLFFEMFVRRINGYFNNSIPPALISTIFCAGLGVVLYFYEPLGEDYQGVTYAPPQDLLALFLPIYATSLIYQMDFFLFTRTLQYVCFICIVGLLVSSTVVCLIIFYVTHPAWDVYDAVLATLAIVPVQPGQIILLFRELAKYKNIATILEAESVGTFVPIYACFQYARSVHAGEVCTWGAHVLYFFRAAAGGLTVGAVVGRATASLMSVLYHEAMGALSFLVGMTFLTYYFAEYFALVSGNLAIVVMASYIVADRHKFATCVDENISHFFQSAQTVAEVTMLGFMVAESMPHVVAHFSPTEIYAALIVYFALTFARTVIFTIFVYVLKKTSMDIDYDMRTGFVLGLSGLKGSFNMVMAFMLLVEPATFAIGCNLVTEIMFMHFYTLLANATPMRLVLRLIGLTELSSMRKTNMNYCMRTIVEARNCIIKTLKSFKYLADANWHMVRQETSISHPYQEKLGLENLNFEDEKESFHANPAICPDCLKEIPYDLNEIEIEDLCFEARSKILKAKKISVIKQFETGAINKNCLQVLLHNIDLMLDTKISHAKLDIDAFLKPNRCLMLLRRFLTNRISKKIRLEPVGLCRRFCFYITNHIGYDYCRMIIALAYIAYVVYSLLQPLILEVLLLHAIAECVFIVDLVIRVLALHALLRPHGWLVYDGIVTTVECALLAAIVLSSAMLPYYFLLALRAVVVARIIRLFSLASALSPHIIAVIDRRIDMKITFGFDLAAALEHCCNEILDSLNQAVEIKVIRVLYERDLRREKIWLVGELQRIQKERPWIAITMKTKQVIRTTLNAMNKSLNELKNAGYVDNIEYNLMDKVITEKIKILRSIRLIKPPTPHVIFSEVPWLGGDKNIIDYLYNKVETLSFDVGDVVVKEGQSSVGVYVVVAGVLKLAYKPKAISRELQRKYGSTPVVDFLSTLDFDKEFHDDIMSGSTFGEKCFLTRRKYDCTITADSPTQTFLLSHDVLMDAKILCSNPVVGLEAKMWKCAAINLAIAVMTDVPLYQTLTQQEIKFKLDRAFVPNLKCYKMFVITEEMDDVLLIEGLAIDYSTNAAFYAPMLIPKHVQKLFLSKSSQLDIDQNMDTKLMIIPSVEAREIEVMFSEEEQAEIVSYTTSKCVLHNVQDLVGKKPKVKKKPVHTVTMLSRPSSETYVERDDDLVIINLDERDREESKASAFSSVSMELSLQPSLNSQRSQRSSDSSTTTFLMKTERNRLSENDP